MKLLFCILLAAIFASPALAAKITEATCSDIASKNHRQVTPQYIAETEGFNSSGKEVFDEIDTTDIVAQAKQVDAQCTKDLSAKVSSVRKTSSPAMSKNDAHLKINPLKSKCSDFVALNEEVQPVAVYWVAGREKSGKLKKDGEFDEVFLEQPVVDLVQECKSHPQDSFYTRTKNWLKKHV